MSYGEFIQQFSAKCNLSEASDGKSWDGYSQSYVKGVTALRKYRVRLSNAEDGMLKNIAPALNGADAVCSDNGNSAIYFNPASYPDFQDVADAELRFDEQKRLSSIEVLYRRKDRSLDELIDSLGLSKWTNWEIETRSQAGELYCNNLRIHASANVAVFGEQESVVIEALTNDEVLHAKNDNYRGEGPQLDPRPVSLPSSISGSSDRARSDEIRKQIADECSRQEAKYGTSSPICGEVEHMTDDEWNNPK